MKKEISIDFKDAKIKELLDRLPYVSEDIQHAFYDVNRKCVEIDIIGEHQWDTIKDTIKELIISISDARIIEQRVIKKNFEYSMLKEYKEDLADPGYLDDVDITIMENLDLIFLTLAKKYHATLREYPTTYSAKNMSKNGYHLRFPQNVYRISRIPHNYSALKTIKENGLTTIPDEYFKSEDSYLQPCLCYHCYQELEHKTIPHLKVFTARGKCFRQEVSWKVNRLRKNEFTMREIIFVGEAEEIYQLRNRVVEDTWEIFEAFGLNGALVTSSDPFFHYDDMKSKGAVQLFSDAKFELDAYISKGEKTSIASFNYCSDMLCKNFNLKNMEGSYLHSGCVGFGLERWKEAIKERHGYGEEMVNIFNEVKKVLASTK
ncbi:aminoacyl--tRNA ligase-related protein [Brevibacillus formosus]|uniref:aminoacyl--tRNA ligase-related protein n=1 Tax=Brevibacillus formosus TaxID=54913 RepID=UPI0018CF1849|nr:aminoacyl--tRNA ligase-related protein [Brevibacillus formosus]MBG9941025.1 hypothetical protein [Brevibacillus formosus]